MRVFLLLFIVFHVGSASNLIAFDLTHAIRPGDPIFPGLAPFNFTVQYTGWKQDDEGQAYFGAVNTFTTTEHFGTHIDAPYHCYNTSWTVEQIPFDHLVSLQALIVDVSKKSAKVSNYAIQISDLNEEAIERAEGYFVLLFYTGKTKHWPDQERYIGGHTREELDFPGLSAALATHLVKKYGDKLVGVGLDTVSLDPGSSKHYPAHRILFQANIYGLENVAALDRVLKHLSSRRETFFSFDVLPMKIEGGTGAPCRLVARLEDFDKAGGAWFGFLIFFLLLAVIGIAAKAVYDLKFNPVRASG